MSGYSFVNGKYVPNYQANISINDRSIHFADAVYEVITVYNFNLLFWHDHIARLRNSLKHLNIKNNIKFETLYFKCLELIKKNDLKEGIIYIHISRGIAKRNHNWSNILKPSIIISCIYKKTFNPNAKKISLISDNDMRWKKCYIKSVSLLPNVLLKQKALLKNAQECIMLDDKGFVTEATTSNVWIIKKNRLITTPLSSNILAGVTRKKIIEFANILKIKVLEKKFKISDIYTADGTFISNSSSLLLEAISLNKKTLKIDHSGLINKIKNIISLSLN